MKINPGFEISPNRHKNCSAVFVFCSAVFFCGSAVLCLCMRTGRTAQGCIGRSGGLYLSASGLYWVASGLYWGPHGCMRAASGAVLGGLEVVLGGLWGCIEQPRGCIGRHQGCIGRPRRCIERVRGCIGRRVFTCACRVQWLFFEMSLGVYFHHGLVFSWWRPAARNSKHQNPARHRELAAHSCDDVRIQTVPFGAELCLCARHFVCTQNIVGFVDHLRRLCYQREFTNTIGEASSDMHFLHA